MDWIQAVILGILQGIFEWLPVSSEGVITLTMIGVFGSNPMESVNAAVYLHLGTMLAALVYFRSDFLDMVKKLPEAVGSLRSGNVYGKGSSKLIPFVFIATLITGILGGGIYLFGLRELASNPKLFTAVMGVALLLTGLLRFYKKDENRRVTDVNNNDTVLVGVLQGLSIIPGVSRSGSTVFGLLYRNFDGKTAFKLSFILSVPAVLAANIGIGLSGFTLDKWMLISTTFSFFVGYLSIEILLKVADRVGVAYLCFLLSALSFLALLI